MTKPTSFGFNSPASAPQLEQTEGTTKEQIIKLFREMLDAWENNEVGENSTANFLSFAKWGITEIEKLVPKPS